MRKTEKARKTPATLLPHLCCFSLSHPLCWSPLCPTHGTYASLLSSSVTQINTATISVSSHSTKFHDSSTFFPTAFTPLKQRSKTHRHRHTHTHTKHTALPPLRLLPLLSVTKRLSFLISFWSFVCFSAIPSCIRRCVNTHSSFSRIQTRTLSFLFHWSV
jgi:hypothetical protein